MHFILQGRTWKCSASLYMPEMYKGELASTPVTTVNSASGKATFKDLRFTEPGRYFLQYKCVSDPKQYNNVFISDAINVFPAGYITPVVEVEKQVHLGILKCVSWNNCRITV